MWFAKLIPMILQTFADMVMDPLIWLVVILVAFQYSKTLRLREELVGSGGDSVIQMTAVSILYGIIAGFVGSVGMIILGISVDKIGFNFLWPLAIMLMLVNIRFICFAYAGGIISLAYLLLGYPKVDVSQLMSLVALLHLMEAILIYLNGHHDALPVYTSIPTGKVVGGYTMQKFWPLPIVAMMITLIPGADYLKDGIQMPDWWPLIKENLHLAKGIQPQYLIISVAAALGYGDIAITTLPKKKAHLSALYLFTFSLILLGLAVIASRLAIFAWMAALFAPLGHELVIKLGRDAEIKGKPLFQAEYNGLRIFEVLPDSPAARAHLQRADLIIAVNGLSVHNKSEFAIAVAECSWNVELNYIDYHSQEKRQVYVSKKIQEPFGLLFPPEEGELPNVSLNTDFFFKRLFQKVFNK